MGPRRHVSTPRSSSRSSSAASQTPQTVQESSSLRYRMDSSGSNMDDSPADERYSLKYDREREVNMDNYPDKSNSVDRQPNIVRIKMTLYLIDNVDSQNQTFFANFYVSAFDTFDRKTDSECEDRSSGTMSFQMSYPDDEKKFRERFKTSLPKWHVNLLNAIDFKDLYREKGLPSTRRFPSDGTFMERQQVNATFFSDFHLECFPFDSQILKIIISLDAPAYVARFDCHLDKHTITQDKSYVCILEKAEWKIYDIFHSVEKKDYKGSSKHNTTPVTSESTLDNAQSNAATSVISRTDSADFKDPRMAYERVHVYIPIKRKSSNYWITILIPLAILNVIALFAFTKTAENDSLTLLATLLLSVFTLKWSITGIVPKISYNCTMDKLFILSFFIIFACMFLVSFDTMFDDFFSSDMICGLSNSDSINHSAVQSNALSTLLGTNATGTTSYKADVHEVHRNSYSSCLNLASMFHTLYEEKAPKWQYLAIILLKFLLVNIISVLFRTKFTKKHVNKETKLVTFGKIYDLEFPGHVENISIWSSVFFFLPQRIFKMSFWKCIFYEPHAVEANPFTTTTATMCASTLDLDVMTSSISTKSNGILKKEEENKKLNISRFWEYIMIMIIDAAVFICGNTQWAYFGHTSVWAWFELKWCRYSLGKSDENCKNDKISIFAHVIMYIIILSLYNIRKDVFECQNEFLKEVERIYKAHKRNNPKAQEKAEKDGDPVFFQ